MTDKLQMYHRLPYPFKVVAASLWGYYLRSWRYGKQTEKFVEEALERERWSQTKIKNWQEERLALILRHAVKNVPYYRDRWEKRRRNGDRSSWEILSNWEILSKREIQNNARAFLAEDCKQSLFSEHTSGTTGSPLILWCKRAMLQEWYALFEARWRRWYGLSFNDRWGLLGGQLVTSFKREKPPFWVWNQGLNQLYLSVAHLRKDWIPYYVDAICKHSIVYLYGYSSALYRLAYEMLKIGKTVDLKSVLSDAEPLHDFQKKVIEEAFHCPVYETYGQGEMVTAASECTEGCLHLWPEVGISEAVDENGQPVRAGIAGQLVATSLMNDAMPLIRYDMQDWIILSDRKACKCGRSLPVLQAIYGRKDDVILTEDGRPIVLLDIIFSPDLHIQEAQIVQEDFHNFRVKVVPTQGWCKKDVERLTSAFKKRAGNVNVDIEPVSEIERTWRGKLRVLVSKVTNPNQAF